MNRKPRAKTDYPSNRALWYSKCTVQCHCTPLWKTTDDNSAARYSNLFFLCNQVLYCNSAKKWKKMTSLHSMLSVNNNFQHWTTINITPNRLASWTYTMSTRDFASFQMNHHHGMTCGHWACVIVDMRIAYREFEPVPLHCARRTVDSYDYLQWRSTSTPWLKKWTAIYYSLVLEMQHFLMASFQETLYELEGKSTSCDMSKIMMRFRNTLLQSRHNFFGMKVNLAMQKKYLPESSMRKLCMLVYGCAISYIQKWFDFDRSPYRALQSWDLPL
jgi:hypothetical protein